MRRFVGSNKRFSCTAVAVNLNHCTNNFSWTSSHSSVYKSSRRYNTDFVTPSFGRVPGPTSQSNSSAQADLGPVRIEAVQGLTNKQMHGPWVCVMPPAIKAVPSGEFMFLPTGVVFFRPGSGLGGGAGTYSISAEGVMTMNVEVYLYEQSTSNPPNDITKLSFTGMIQQAVIGSHQATILTCQGRVTLSTGETGEFQAAKMDGWSPEQQVPAPWFPDATVTDQLAMILPPLQSFPPRKRVNLDKHKVGDIKNLMYIPNWITEDEENVMLKILKSTPDLVKSKMTKRLVQEWGCTMCKTCNTSFVSEGNIPPWCQQICDGLVETSVFHVPTFPNNVRIHEYEAGEGIAPHVDGPIYVPVVAILSLASPCLMSFYPRQAPYDNPMEHYNDSFRFDGDIAKQRPHCSMILEPRSLLVFSHDAYWFHPHGISDKPVDSLLEKDVGPIVNRHLVTQVPANATQLERKYRVGVTVRNLLPRCNDQPTRAEYFMNKTIELLNPQLKAKAAMPASTSTSTTPPKPTISTPKPSPLPQTRKPIVSAPAASNPKPSFVPPVPLPQPHANHPTPTPTSFPLTGGFQQPQTPPPPFAAPPMQPYPPMMSPYQPYGGMAPWYGYPPFPQPYGMYPPAMPPAQPPMNPYAHMSQPPSQQAPPSSVNSLDNERIAKLESQVQDLTNTLKTFQNETKTILEALLHSHVRNKDDQGQILDNLCKAVVNVDAAVKQLIDEMPLNKKD